jgi:hypothetical protein
MFSGLQLVTAPTAACVSVADVKAHTRVTNDADDSLLVGYISAAERHAETITNRALMPQTWLYTLEHWPGRAKGVGFKLVGNVADFAKYDHFQVPKPPMVSVVSFFYYDTANNQYSMFQSYQNTVVGAYFVDLTTEPAMIRLPFAGIWPTTVLLPGSPIQLTFNCGYSGYSGLVNVAANGLITLLPVGSPPVQGSWDPKLVGTWITVTDSLGNSQSFGVVSNPSSTQLQVAVPLPCNVTLPLNNASFTANTVPMKIRQAICFLSAHLFQIREPVITGRGEVAVEVPTTFDDLLYSERVGIIGLDAQD